MHLGIPALLEFYREHREEPALVLATIIGTEGSTYRKPGAMMLISRSGSFAGLISGGCLESDLLHHAGNVFESGQPDFLTYDMHANDELVWNLGLGCDGVIHLLLQRREEGAGPVAARHLVLAVRRVETEVGEHRADVVGLQGTAKRAQRGAQLWAADLRG